MCASCWVLALCIVSLWHPLSVALALWLLTASIAFAIAYLAFEAWYRISGHQTFASPWGLLAAFAVLAVVWGLFRLIFQWSERHSRTPAVSESHGLWPYSFSHRAFECGVRVPQSSHKVPAYAPRPERKLYSK